MNDKRSSLNRTLIAVAGVALLFALAPVCRAQERTTLRRVEIIGLQRLSSDQVLAATGLKVGDSIDGRLIDAAADKLMRSGWFSSVNYRVNTADNDSTVIFEVAEKAVPTNPGASDAIGQVSWRGNSALSSEELSTALGLRAGEPAGRARIDQALESVRKAYARRGYVNAQITETSTRDAATRRTNYEFTVREGQQFRMGAVNILGLSVAEARQLKARWTLAPGAVFDDSYLDQFRTTVIRPFIADRAQRTGVRSKFEVSTKPDTQKQTVDVIITFR